LKPLAIFLLARRLASAMVECPLQATGIDAIRISVDTSMGKIDCAMPSPGPLIPIWHGSSSIDQEICGWLSKISALRDKDQDVGRANASAEGRPLAISMNFIRSGEWLPADELRAKAMEAAHTKVDIHLDTADVDHLDTAALQILLALDKDRRDKGLRLHLMNASRSLRQWFEYAGMPPHLLGQSAEQP
jgi:ABC-type transporter Mla MlaB component